MAGGSLLMLLDDISVIMDDVSVMAKVAAKKTVGVLGDDLALNAEQVSGVNPSRELPVVWAVAKGSFVNKLILVPAALLISYFVPWLITPLLMIGGLFLCFEGAEKVVHKFWPRLLPEDEEQHARIAANADESVDLVAMEKEKVKGAIRTDFILSAEIVVISLGTLTTASLLDKSLVLSLIAVVTTIGIYGLVAVIVKIDDVGLHIMQRPGASNIAKKIGQLMLVVAPKLMKILTILGTLAMFLVGGGIIVHGLHSLHLAVEDLAHLTGVFQGLSTNLLNGVIGLAIGLVVLILMTFIKKMRSKAH
ncbi:DUF808 domain-containing protein [Psychrobacter sp.]|uniref:DUF808 domain-containing protein n=1 Tax=Psychrobacter sp. TaxID=56811 RepID=UPI0025CCB8F1|nr:DUF808 domain-containing protein [Psychrobacter sp.]